MRVHSGQKIKSVHTSFFRVKSSWSLLLLCNVTLLLYFMMVSVIHMLKYLCTAYNRVYVSHEGTMKDGEVTFKLVHT